jgi:hypothetical protein
MATEQRSQQEERLLDMFLKMVQQMQQLLQQALHQSNFNILQKLQIIGNQQSFKLTGELHSRLYNANRSKRTTILQQSPEFPAAGSPSGGLVH